jgi:hypothetical protein
MSGDSEDHAPMTIGHLTPLTELERDALGEVSNIAMARAANSLRQMVERGSALRSRCRDFVPGSGNPARGQAG